MGDGDADCDPSVPKNYAHCSTKNSPAGCYYGYHWQCVEFVKRFYGTRNDGFQLDPSNWDTPVAKAFFVTSGADYQITLDPQGNPSSDIKGFQAYRNGSSTSNGSPNLPQPDDIMVFDDGGPTGHVAIVKDTDGASYVDVIEQNFSHSGVCSIPISGGAVSKRGSFTVVGWLRSQNASTPPASPTPVIGNLVTNPSPTMVGNFKIIITNAANVDPSNVFLYMTGPDCTAANGNYTCSVTTSNLSIQNNASSITAPVNVANQGDFYVYLQNGISGTPSTGWHLQVQAPVPSITGLLPSSLPIASTGQTILINGNGFTPTAALSFNNQYHTATYVSTSQMSMVTAYADVSSAGSYPIVVTNSGPGGGSSAASNLTVTIATPVMSVTPSSLSFGSQKIGTAAVKQSVTIQNGGSGSMAIPSASITGTNASDFAVSNSCTSALSAGQSCQIQVGFTPGSTGSRSATLTISSSGASGSPQTVAFYGQGVSGGVQITATVSPTNPTVGIALPDLLHQRDC